MRRSKNTRQMVLFLGALMLMMCGFTGDARAQSPCTGAPGERMVGVTQSGNGVAGTPICVQDGGGNITSAPRPATFRAPPPPKGWQPLWGATIEFPTWVHSSDNEASARYGYAVAVNYSTEGEARKAVLDQCLREVMPGREEECTGTRITPFNRAYFRLVVDTPLGWSMDDFTQLKPLIETRESFAFGNEGYVECDQTLRAERRCFDAIMALGRNGVHTQPLEKEAMGIVACPNGPSQPEQKIVGSDGNSGKPLPLCGPDWDAIEARLHAGRYDGLAVHPLMKSAPLSSGGHADAASAERAALQLCTGMLGQGCSVLGSDADGFFAVAASDVGQMFLGKGADIASARRDAQSQCDTSAGQIIPCAIILIRTAGVRYKQAPSPEYVRDYAWARYGAIALPGNQVTDYTYAVISRGMLTREEAEREALRLCAQENPNGPKCQIAASAAGVLLTVWVGEDGSMGGFSSLSSFPAGFSERNTRRDDLLAVICGKRQIRCKIDEVENTEVSEPMIASYSISTFEER